MRAAKIFGLIPFVLTAAEEQIESLSSALKVDDACESGSDCEVSLRQLRGESKLSSDSQQPLLVSSSFSEDINYEATRTCDVTELDADSDGGLYSAFSRTRDGLSWNSKTMVLSVDSQPMMFETVHPEWPLALRLSLNFEAETDQNTSILISGLQAVVPSKLSLTAPQCQMAKPGCYGQKHCYVDKPVGGWASPDNVIVQPLSKVISVNVTSIINTDLGSVQVWAVPSTLPEDGLWKTPMIKVFNWRFFNLGGGGASAEDDDGEEFW